MKENKPTPKNKSAKNKSAKSKSACAPRLAAPKPNPAPGDLPFSNEIHLMWLDGEKQEVLEIARERLKTNPDDIVGIVLTLQHHMAFFDLPNLKKMTARFIEIGDKIATPHFSRAYPENKMILAMVSVLMPEYSPEEAEEESAKGNIVGKPMELFELLQAAEADGWVG